MLNSISALLDDTHVRDFKKEKEVDKAVLEISKMFTRSTFKSIFNEDEKSSIFGDTHASENWKFLFLNTMADTCAGHTGIEDSIRRSVSKNPYQANAAIKGGEAHALA